MASTADSTAFVAANHYGLGLRPGEHAAVARDPRAWLRIQLEGIHRLPHEYADLPHSSAIIQEEAEVRRRLREMARRSTNPEDARGRTRLLRREIHQRNRGFLEKRLAVAITTDAPFAERLVRFWSNHFTIAASGGAKAVLNGLGVAYENEAIRPRLNGSFADLVVTVEQHPAMLIYLDNVASIGPDSPLGRRSGRGLNENLAREILELHTLGVNGGYRQSDVTNLARIITGWTVPGAGPGGRRLSRGASNPGTFRFVNAMHEPGSHVLLNQAYSGGSAAQGERALRDLAHHPATARHVATKLVRHFVADDPPAQAVAEIERVFLDSGGHLPAVHEALIDLEEAWQGKHKKLKTPEELVVSTARALGMTGLPAASRPGPRALGGALALFNQAPFSAPSPAGWPDEAAHWGSPDALMKRIEWANAVALRAPGAPDPALLVREILPENPTLHREIDRAESSRQGLALLLASPDFQWR